MINLHIIIYSELMKYGGGRETWLQYFLKELIEFDFIIKIYVYHLEPKDNGAYIGRDYLNSNRIEFTKIVVNKRLNPFIKILTFSIKASKVMKLKTKMGKKNIVLLIGTLAEGVSGILIRVLIKELKIITWIRTITIGEISSRKSKAFAYMTAIIEYMIIVMSNKVITNGEDTLYHYKNKYKKFKSKFKCVPNAIYVNQFNNITSPCSDNDKVSVAYMGRLANAKGFPEFVKSVRNYFDKNPYNGKIQFNVYGYGEGENLLIDEINYYGKFNSKQIKGILEKNDAVVFLNKSNNAGGLSHSLLEAMASGRIIIAWDNLIHNQVLNNKNSFLIPENDIGSLNHIYENLINTTSSELQKISSNTKVDSKKYDVAAHMKKFINVLNEVNNKD